MAYDIIILAGQSNMAGVGEPYGPETDPPHPQVFQFNLSNAIVPATEPLAFNGGAGGIGPGFQFARRYIAAGLNGDRDVLLIPAARGGTPLVTTEGRTWNPNVAGSFYDQQTARIAAAITAAGPGSRVVCALWSQGEADGTTNQSRADYLPLLEQLIAGFRTVTNEPSLPFIIGQMVPENMADGTRRQINLAHMAVPHQVPFTGFVDSPVGHHQPGDINHFNAAGQRIIAERMFDAYRHVANGLVMPERTLFGDDFQRPDSPTPGATPLGGLPWVQTSNATMSIASGLAQVEAGGAPRPAVAVLDPDSADGELQAVYAANNSSKGMLIFRYVDFTRFLYLGQMSSAEPTWALRKYDNGRTTTIADLGVPMTAGDALQVNLNGPSVTVSINLQTVYSGDVTTYAEDGDRHGLGSVSPGGTPDQWAYVGFRTTSGT